MGATLSKLTTGVIGLGYWGPNVVRNFIENTDIEVKSCFDARPERGQFIKQRYPSVTITENINSVIEDAAIDLVAVCTPVDSHFEIARSVLNAGKHVLIEKPMTYSVREAEELVELAEKSGLRIFVDHTFLFTGAVRKIKQLMDDGELGDTYYFDSSRVNLGLFRHDVNVIWDLAAHDISIMHYLLGMVPEEVIATGARHIDNNLEDLAHIAVYFPGNLLAHINVSWLSPVKVRQTMVAGSKKMVVWDDNQPSEKLRIYDKGVDLIDSDTKIYETLIQYRTGDMYCPKIDTREALAVEAAHIVNCLTANEKPISDGIAGLEVVKVLEAAQKSIENKGRAFKIS